MGIEQARQWGVCTMNEFRKFLGLKRLYNLPLTFSLSLTFTNLQNSKSLRSGTLTLKSRYNVSVDIMLFSRLTVLFQGAARRVYGHIDNLELYVWLLIVHSRNIIEIYSSYSQVSRRNLQCH